MKKYNCLQTLGLAFYSPDLYRDVAKNWGATVVFYLLLLVALCSVLHVISIQHEINASFEGVGGSYLDKLALQFPLITLKNNGTIETPENKPYIIYDPEDKQILMVIDTSGHYTSLENQPYDTLITKTQYMTRKKNGDLQIHTWPKGIDYAAHPEEVKEVIKEWSARAWILIFPLMIIPIFIWRLIVAGLYAIFGLLMSKIIGSQLSYYTSFGLTIVALTPALLLRALLDLMNLNFPHETLFFFILTMFYLYFGIKANKEDLPQASSKV